MAGVPSRLSEPFLACEEAKERLPIRKLAKSSTFIVREEIQRRRAWIFLTVGFPGGAGAVICILAAVLACFEGWHFRQAVGFMASAMTGGAIQLEGSDVIVIELHSKLLVAFAGAASVGSFGFMAALLGTLIPEDLPEKLGKSSARGAATRFAFSATIVVLLMLLFAALFGGILSIVEGEAFCTSWRTMASIQVGGGIPGQAHLPKTSLGTAMIIMVGFWGIEVAAAMISVVGNAFAFFLRENFGSKFKDELSFIQALVVWSVMAQLAVPAMLIIAMAFNGGILALFFDRDFWQSFWRALPVVSGGAATVYPQDDDTTGMVEAFLVLSATVGQLIMSTGIAMSSCILEQVCEVAGRVTESPVMPTQGENSWGAMRRTITERVRCRLRRAILALCAALFVLIPTFVMVFAFPTGRLLAAVEGWTLQDGLWWCVAAQLGGGMQLSTGGITNDAGRAAGAVAAAWSVGVAGLSVGLSSSPAVRPLVFKFWGLKEKDRDKRVTRRMLREAATCPALP